ncbi:C40 family peptidase [Gordonia jinhuaensis]|uniref:Endopeptidase Cgl2188 n=1 Tax=Gordonia jinhuaensis TaxID=1517702 RepID=A0A916WND0_9ACTN|nr:C40 family peptidase [Gordonia jinhuaensis]GGB18983.1 putative endopeptidase Cgl2188 [Gordonia jinhuaensis]
MAKHRLQKPSRGKKVAKNAVVAGSLTLGAVGVTAGPALAAPVTIPGIGTYEIPGVNENQIPKELRADPKAPVLSLPAISLPNTGSQTPKAKPSQPVRHASVGQRAASIAETKVGAPYEYGAAGPSAFDCSGLVYWAYKQVGLTVPRDSYGQLGGGQPVSLNALAPGDVLIFNGGSHAGMYIGNGRYIQASTYGVPVGVSTLASADVYAARRY